MEDIQSIAIIGHHIYCYFSKYTYWDKSKCMAEKSILRDWLESYSTPQFAHLLIFLFIHLQTSSVLMLR